MLEAREPVDTATQNGRPGESIALLSAEPDLARHLSVAQAESAEGSLRVPLVRLAAGPFELEAILDTPHAAFAARVVSGLVLSEVSIGAGQPTLSLAGPGDLMRPHDGAAASIEAEHRLSAASSVELALMDDRLLVALRHWPRLMTAFVERLLDQHDTAILQLAISQQPRVEERLLRLFVLLADRWGTMTSDGVVVHLKLTHEALGRLVGARRPTVTLALRALADSGRMSRSEDGSWLLRSFAFGPVNGAEPLTARHVAPTELGFQPDGCRAGLRTWFG